MNKSLFLIFFVFLGFSFEVLGLNLVLDGKTQYCIVQDSNNIHAIDAFAGQELQHFLQEISDAHFAIVSPAQASNRSKRIFLGDKEKIAGMAPGEIELLSHDEDIYLHGEGKHGTLWAVYEFLENQLGCRWLNAHGAAYIPKKHDIILSPLAQKIRYAFPERSIMIYFYEDKTSASLFAYRNRQNLLLEAETIPGVENATTIYRPTVHTLSTYIPAGNQEGRNHGLPCLSNQNYFETNPEFFSLTETGERNPWRQLCFSNPELRKELSKNILLQYQLEKKRTGTDKGVVTIDCNDHATRICYCPGCIQLEKKYQAYGGPIFDYLIDIARKHPDITFKTLAYQRNQTQIPPKMTEAFPDNLLIVFAPINGDFSQTLEGERNRPDLANLKEWRQLTNNIWLWYYPNTYLRDKSPHDFFTSPPLANLTRIARDIQIMAALKLRGTFFEHDSGGIKLGANFSELQSWVMLKLFQNPDQDVSALTKEFIRLYYGTAAPKVQQYYDALASEFHQLVQAGSSWSHKVSHFSYLTLPRMLQWDNWLEEAEKSCSDEYAFRVRLLRLSLDSAIITKMANNDNMELFCVCQKRMEKTTQELATKRSVNKELLARLDPWLEIKAARRPPKPLPIQLQQIPAEDLILVRPQQNSHITTVPDAEANFAQASFESITDTKFKLQAYDYQNKITSAITMIDLQKVKADDYQLYQLSGPVTLTPRTFIVGGRWTIALPVGRYCSADDPASLAQLWDVYVSLRFLKNAENTIVSVHCDGGYLVRHAANKDNVK